MKKSILFPVLLMACIFCSCEKIVPILENKTNPDEEPVIRNGGIIDRIFDRPNPRPLYLNANEIEQSYSQMGADFGMKLFKYLCENAKDGENVCISPLSLEIALGMLANGVEPEAQRELLDSIAGKDVTSDSLNVWYQKMRSAFQATNSIALANALWTQEGYTINPNFIEVNKASYDAEIGYLDFTQTQEAKDSICQWAYDHTYGQIRELNLPIDPRTRLVLANATWFSANWSQQFGIIFEELGFEEQTFKRSDGQISHIEEMMRKIGTYKYAEDSSYRLIDIPIGWYNFSMLVALPNEGLTPNEILPKLDWNLPTYNTFVELRLPKFSFKTTNELKLPLKELGIRKAFEPYRLTGINRELQVGFVNQDISVKIHQYGVEMAALTTLGMLVGANLGEKEETPIPVPFFVDRPFVFAVRDNVCHNILFIGKVEDLK